MLKAWVATRLLFTTLLQRLNLLCYADGLSPESTDESDTVLRSAHLEQDEVIRQENRQKTQQQKAPQGTDAQGSQLKAELQRASDETTRQDALRLAQEQQATEKASRQESVERAQAVVSPFTRATVHRQIGNHHVININYVFQQMLGVWYCQAGLFWASRHGRHV